MTTVGATEDNRSAEITCTKSEESSVITTDDECWISIENYKVDETTKKPQIERVPSLLRKSKSYESCIHPSVVSIGPYHHGKLQFEAFEKLKTPIAQKLCRVLQVSIKRLYEEVAKEGESARECYEKGSTDLFDDKSFNKMMFLDASFVVHFLLIGIGYNTTVEGDECGEADARLEKNFYLVLTDLFLLENQIPLLVLKVLMKYILPTPEAPSTGEDIIQESTPAAPSKGEDIMKESTPEAPSKGEDITKESMPEAPSKGEDIIIKESTPGEVIIMEFLELYTIVLPKRESSTSAVKKFLAQMMGRSSKSDQDKKRKELVKALGTSPHLLHLMREQLIQPHMHEIKNWITFIFESKSNFRESNIQESYRSVTDLKSAGVYFIPSQTGSLTDVEFISRNIFGILTIPPVKVDHLTKPLLLNLAAYEMCPHGPSDFCITSYISLMDSLIDHADDVQELRKKRILINKLGSDEQLARLYNEIANHLEPDPRAYAHARLKIDKHCNHKGHIWMAEWIHKYFSSPWALLAFIGAIFVVALTMAQTYFAAYPR